MTITLGLDLGQSIGWFKAAAVGPATWGTFAMPKTRDLGAWLRGSDPFFREHLNGVDQIAVEMPFMGQDISPTIRLFGLLSHCAYWASFHGIGESGFNRVPISTAKLTLSGNHMADKDQMVEAAERQGYFGMTHHEADALSVWWVVALGRAETKDERRKRERQARRTTTP